MLIRSFAELLFVKRAGGDLRVRGKASAVLIAPGTPTIARLRGEVLGLVFPSIRDRTDLGLMGWSEGREIDDLAGLAKVPVASRPRSTKYVDVFEVRLLVHRRDFEFYYC